MIYKRQRKYKASLTSWKATVESVGSSASYDEMNDIGSFVLQGGHRGQVGFADVLYFETEAVREYLESLTEK